MPCASLRSNRRQKVEVELSTFHNTEEEISTPTVNDSMPRRKFLDIVTKTFYFSLLQQDFFTLILKNRIKIQKNERKKNFLLLRK